MGVLDFIAGLAAVLLALELTVVALLAAALCGGLWFGLRLGHRKLDAVFSKLNGYLGTARSIEQRGLAIAVKPFILAHVTGERIGATVSALVDQVREASSR